MSSSSFVSGLKWTGYVILVVVIAFAPFLTYASVIMYENFSYDLEKSPYVHWAGLEPSSQVYISWETNDETPSTVWIGTDQLYLSPDYQNTTVTQFHRILFTGLNPDTTYYYRVGFVRADGNTVYIGPVSQFKTSPVGYKPYNFTVISDSQSQFGAGFYDQLSRRFGRPDFSTDFLSIMGDIVDVGTFQYEWNRFFKETASFGNRIPILPVIGNHDGRSAESLYRRYFGVSTSPDSFYYAYNYSTTQFICAEYSDWKGMTAEDINKQVEWINQTLRNGQSQKWRIIMVHRVEAWLEPFFEGFNVSMVICGHIHSYDRYTEKNLPVIQLGSGGSIQDLFYIVKNSSQEVRVQPCYTKVAISDTSIDIHTFSAQDVLLDSFTYGGTL